MREAHVSAQQPQAQEEARIPSPDEDARGAGHREGSPAARPEAALRLIWRIRDRGTFDALGRVPSRAVGPIRLRSVSLPRGDTETPPRVAYAIGRSVGSAVERNRLRRRVRAVVRAHRALLQPDTAYLVAAGPRARAMTHEQLMAAMERLLSAQAAS